MPSISLLALLSLFSCADLHSHSATIRPQTRPLVGTGAQPLPPQCQGMLAQDVLGAAEEPAPTALAGVAPVALPLEVALVAMLAALGQPLQT